MRQVLGILIFLCTLTAHATTSVSFLHGDTFRNDLGYERSKTTMTVESFNVWEYGTVFYYFDLTEPFSSTKGDANQYFGGISPTFSLTRLTGRDWSYGFIKDVSIRLELENGSGSGVYNFRNYFYGLQYDLIVPGFDFFSLNTVLRDNPIQNGVGFQIGTFWQMTWEYGPWSRFKFTGFVAASPWDGNGKQAAGAPKISAQGRFLTAQPQLLYDLGLGLTGKSNRLEVGFEYAYFVNRYQFANKDEKVLQAMVKFTY